MTTMSTLTVSISIIAELGSYYRFLLLLISEPGEYHPWALPAPSGLLEYPFIMFELMTDRSGNRPVSSFFLLSVELTKFPK